MKVKTIFIIIITAILTTFLVINNDAVYFDFLIGDPLPLSKLVVIGVCILIGFILGFLVGRPRKTVSSYDTEIEKEYHTPIENKSSLSNEDRDYIS